MINGTPSIPKPTAAGAANNIPNLSAQLMSSEYSDLFLFDRLLDKLGKSIVLNATPSIPAGNSSNLSA